MKQSKEHIEKRNKNRNKTLAIKTLNSMPLNIKSIIIGHIKNGWGSWMIMKNIYVMNNGYKISRNKINRIINIYNNPEKYSLSQEEMMKMFGLNIPSIEEIKKMLN